MRFENQGQYPSHHASEMNNAMNRVIRRYANQYSNQIGSNNVSSALSLVIAPFMASTLSKYSEADFHRALSGRYIDEAGKVCPGFDFIKDWRENHAIGFNILLYVARNMRDSLNFNPDVAAKLIIEIVKEWKWKVTYQEALAIRHLIFRVKRLIFS